MTPKKYFFIPTSLWKTKRCKSKYSQKSQQIENERRKKKPQTYFAIRRMERKQITLPLKSTYISGTNDSSLLRSNIWVNASEIYKWKVYLRKPCWMHSNQVHLISPDFIKYKILYYSFGRQSMENVQVMKLFKSTFKLQLTWCFPVWPLLSRYIYFWGYSQGIGIKWILS